MRAFLGFRRAALLGHGEVVRCTAHVPDGADFGPIRIHPTWCSRGAFELVAETPPALFASADWRLAGPFPPRPTQAGPEAFGMPVTVERRAIDAA